ncbi:MAG: hypothetical protein K0Q90_331 [Paenibacillaceae bacterium]|jgi:hypothetical protein|nr:hypothetical protein [Paenibacillaceae bacterium]
MPRYAQIDLDTGRCISVSLLAGEIESDHMFPLGDNEEIQPGDIYMDGGWTRPDQEPLPEPGPSAEERITILEQQLTDTQIALVESCESNLADKKEITSLQVALTEVYEQLLVIMGGDS